MLSENCFIAIGSCNIIKTRASFIRVLSNEQMQLVKSWEHMANLHCLFEVTVIQDRLMSTTVRGVTSAHKGLINASETPSDNSEGFETDILLAFLCFINIAVHVNPLLCHQSLDTRFHVCVSVCATEETVSMYFLLLEEGCYV